MIRILSVLIAALVLSGNVTNADTITQTVSLSENNADNLFSEPSGSNTDFELVDQEFFSLTAMPFDNSLGSLTSFSVSFVDISISGTGTSAENFGSVNTALNGQFSIGGFGFNGVGVNGFSIAENQGDTLEFGTTFDFDQTFFASDAGLDFNDPNAVGLPFNPGILAAVTGTAPFEVLFTSNNPIVVSLNGVNDAFVEASGTISLEYHFEPIPTPEPSSAVLVIVGLTGMAARRRRRV